MGHPAATTGRDAGVRSQSTGMQVRADTATIGGVDMHDGQLRIDVDVARQLIHAQFSELAGLPVREVRSAGTVNAIFRVGTSYAARFPLSPQDPTAARTRLEAEADSATELATYSTVPTPTMVGIGEPDGGYPLPWSLQTWLPGSDATVSDPTGSAGFALELTTFITGLRRADTRGRRFAGQGRGGELPDHDDWVEHCFTQSERLLDVAPLRKKWADLRTLPRPRGDLMCHGDLTPPNVLVEHGHLVGVLDAGGFAAADPSLDLVSAWHLLDSGQRESLRTELGCGEVEWLRGTAWALQQAVGLVWYYRESNPAMSRWGGRTLRRILDERPD